VHKGTFCFEARCFPTRYTVDSSVLVGNDGQPNEVSTRSQEQMPLQSGSGLARLASCESSATIGRNSNVACTMGRRTCLKALTSWSQIVSRSQRLSSMAAR